MTLKKYDLAKNLGLKIANQRKQSAIPERFGAAAAVSDKREQRRLDAAAGLVPFACKLPAPLAQALRERAAAHPGGVNGLVAELLQQGLSSSS
jgi:plasmid stability protein